MIWWMSAALAAPCPSSHTVVDLDRQLLSAEAAIGQLQSDRFLTETEDLTQRVACLAEAATPAFAAHVHRVIGMRAFIGRQGDDVAAAFAAARDADPTYVWPETVLPPAHGIRDQLAEAPALDAVRPLPRPRGGELRFDGVASTERPVDRPTIMQVLDPDGGVTASGWLHPNDAALPYDATRPLLPPLPTGPRRVRTSLLLTAAATSTAAVGLYGWASVGPARTFQEATTLDELTASRRSVNTLVTLSSVSGAVAATSLTSALLFGRF